MISAIILAAGESKRMGEQKLLMRWGNTTVLQHVVSVFAAAGLDKIVVVTGSHRNQIESLFSSIHSDHRIHLIFNEKFSAGEMLSSVQCGLASLIESGASAALIGLGDQPQVREGTVRKVCDKYRKEGHPLVVPSFGMRRGHPWLVARKFWSEMLGLASPQTPRDFLIRHAEKISYVDANDASILSDLDTPDDYRNTHP